MASQEPEQIVPTELQKQHIGFEQSQHPSLPAYVDANGQIVGKDGFVARVSSIPVVNSAVHTLSNIYETSKASSSILKYGAETVESSVMKVYRPLQAIVEPQLNEIDNFGCKQLDKLQEQFPMVMEKPEHLYQKGTKYLSDMAGNAMDRLFTGSPDDKRVKGHHDESDELINGDYPVTKRNGVRRRHRHNGNGNGNGNSNSNGNGNGHINGSATDNGHTDENGSTTSDSDGDYDEATGRPNGTSRRKQSRSQENAVVQKNPSPPESSWKSLSGIYGKSYDSLQVVRDTVSLMQVVEMHIERQTSYLSEALRQLQVYMLNQSTALTTEYAQKRDMWLQGISVTTSNIRRDIVNALRQVVDAISRSAVFMPAYAQVRIKDFILSLPHRWASGTSSALTSLIGGKEVETRFLAEGHQMISLATETRMMLQSITAIFMQYIDRATALLQSFGAFLPPTPVAEAPVGAITNGSVHHAPAPSHPDDKQDMFSAPASPNGNGAPHTVASPFSIATILNQDNGQERMDVDS